jgi:hypothetical protein
MIGFSHHHSVAYAKSNLHPVWRPYLAPSCVGVTSSRPRSLEAEPRVAGADLVQCRVSCSPSGFAVNETTSVPLRGTLALNQPIAVYNNWSSYDELSDNIELTEALAMKELDEILRPSRTRNQTEVLDKEAPHRFHKLGTFFGAAFPERGHCLPRSCRRRSPFSVFVRRQGALERISGHLKSPAVQPFKPLTNGG